MKSSISYQNCFIRSESFQREKNGKWIPQYTLRRQDSKNEVNDFLSHQAQLEKVFATENAADDFALQEAMKWIDKKAKLKS
jgi:predicted membrane chloride channel (bestrophin family)